MKAPLHGDHRDAFQLPHDQLSFVPHHPSPDHAGDAGVRERPAIAETLGQTAESRAENQGHFGSGFEMRSDERCRLLESYENHRPYELMQKPRRCQLVVGNLAGSSTKVSPTHKRTAAQR